MTEGIDTSEQLSLKAIETSLSVRLKRGDVEYNGRTVFVSHKDPRRTHPLQRLLDKGYLEAYHVYTGQRYKDLRDSAFPESAIRSDRTTFTGSGFGVCTKTLYARVARAMTPKNAQRVNPLAFAETNIDGFYAYSDADINAIGSMSPDYQAAFEILEALILEKKSELEKAVINVTHA